MGEGWDKDAWILRAVQAGQYRVERDGRVFRRKFVAARGKHPPRVQWEPQPMSTHERTGRVFFQMRFEAITKSVLLNRVVALIHIPNPLGLPEVNHKFGNLQDNRDEMLEWAGRSAQEKHAFAHGLKANRGTANANAKLTPDAVDQIRTSSADPHALARTFGVTVQTIENVKARRTWEHV